MTQPLYQLADQWNDATRTYDGIMMNVADAGHAVGSDLLDLQMNGVSQFKVIAPDSTNPNGGVLLVNDIHFFRETDQPVVRGALAVRNGNIPQVIRVYNTYTDDNNWERAGFGWTLTGNTLGIGMVNKGSGLARPVAFYGANFLLSRTGDPTTFTPDTDTGFFRNAAGVLEVNNGAPGTTSGCYLKWGGTARCPGDFPITNSTALTDIGGLVVSVKAGRAYSIDVELSVTNTAVAAGFQAAIGGNCAATNIIYDGWIVDSAANGIKGNAQATALNGVVASNVAALVGTAYHVSIKGTIEVSTSGTLTVRGAQKTANATATQVKRGSRLIVHDIT